jgi:uncharacterized protein YjbI with pentapeptide repeats
MDTPLTDYGFQGADMGEADFTGADLRETNMSSTRGSGAIFRHANLCKAT